MFGKAWAKAIERDRLQQDGATRKTDQPTSVGIAYWLDPSRPTPKDGWGSSHRRNMEIYERYYFTPILGKVRHRDLNLDHLERCVNAAPNKSEGDNVRRALSQARRGSDCRARAGG